MTTYARRDSRSLENRAVPLTSGEDERSYVVAVRAPGIGLFALEKWVVVDRRGHLAQATALYGRAAAYLAGRGEAVLVSRRMVGGQQEMRILQRHRADGAVPVSSFADIDETSRKVFWDRAFNQGPKEISPKTANAVAFAKKQQPKPVSGRQAATMLLAVVGAGAMIWVLSLPGVLPVLAFFGEATVRVVTFR